MTAAEMRAKGYSAYRDGTVITVLQNGERVASLSPMHSGNYGFDWHRHDQWSLRSHDVVALVEAGQ